MRINHYAAFFALALGLAAHAAEGGSESSGPPPDSFPSNCVSLVQAKQQRARAAATPMNGINFENADNTLESFQPGPASDPASSSRQLALDLTRRLLDVSKSETVGLFIEGATGVGKSHLAVGFARAAMAQKRLAVYLNPANYLNYNDYLSGAGTNIALLSTYEVFVFDQFTVDDVEHALYKEIFQEVLDEAFKTGGKKILVTSQNSLSEIAKWLGGRDRNRQAFYLDRLRTVFRAVKIEGKTQRPSASW